MSIFRADFDVQTSTVLPVESPSLRLRSYGGDLEIILRNAKPDADGHVPFLEVTVIGSCDSLDTAPITFREALANHLDVLTFVTQSKFQIVQCRRVMEWEPFLKSRKLKAFGTFRDDYPPSPDLQEEIVETASAIIFSGPAGFVRRALHHFRSGVVSRQAEDQFHQFWLALEIIAENQKESSSVAVPCQKCSAPLRCEVCQKEQKRRPLPTEAMKSIVSSIVLDQSADVFKRLTEVRNGVVHARSRASIEKAAGVPLLDAVNEVAKIAWHAIYAAMPATLQGEFDFMHNGGDFAFKELIASGVFGFDHDGEGEHPADDKIPSATISMHTRFGKPPPDNDATG